MPPPRPRLRAAIPVAAAAAFLAGGTAAQGQPTLSLTRCPAPAGFQCGTLTVPLDRADPALGTVPLAVRRLPHRGTLRGTLVFLAGGPGQSAIRPDGGLELQLRDAAPGYEVVVFDQRGTGANALRCPGLERSDTPSSTEAVAALVSACAGEIGPRRARHSTADSVADLEALRLALGRERITPFGVSYGTLVATWYARTHPAATAGMILDSPVSPQGNAVVEPEAYAAGRRALTELCARGRCRGVTRDILGDVARLEARLAAGGLRGLAVNRSGRTVRTVFGGPDEPSALFQALGRGDLSAEARGVFPAAVKLALRGDPALLLRITADNEPPSRPRDFSVGLFLATACADSNLPWTAGQTVTERLGSATAALGAVDPAVTTPFTRPGVDSALVLVCAGWPEAPIATPPTAAVPDVPTLLIAGSQDVRTPLETARSIAATLPRASVVRAAGGGHSSISAANECTVEAIERFLARRAVGQPCATSALPEIAPVPPARLADLRPLGLPARRGRTVRAVVDTLDDVQRAIQLGAPDARGTFRFTGLRGGRGTVATTAGAGPAFPGVLVRFSGYVYVPGVVLSGTVRNDGFSTSANLRVSGPAAARGRLTLVAGRVRGTLGGRPVDVRR